MVVRIDAVSPSPCAVRLSPKCRIIEPEVSTSTITRLLISWARAGRSPTRRVAAATTARATRPWWFRCFRLMWPSLSLLVVARPLRRCVSLLGLHDLELHAAVGLAPLLRLVVGDGDVGTVAARDQPLSGDATAHQVCLHGIRPILRQF